VPVGKESIKRAAGAGKKASPRTAAKAAEAKAAEQQNAVAEPEVKTSVIAAPAVEITPEHSQIRIGEELPVYLL
jgi:hypothetical protein